MLQKRLYYLKHYVTPSKLYNLALNKYEARRKDIYLKSFPIDIYIEPINTCNLSCPSCITGIRHAESIPPTTLKFDKFKYIFEQCKETTVRISLFHWGEPLINKELFLMIKYASSAKCGAVLSSNFTIFNESMAEQAIFSKLTHIYLSIDGATQETYEKYRRGGDISRVFENIRILVKKKRELKSLVPFLTWRYLVFPHNRHEIEMARQKAKELGVDNFVCAIDFGDYLISSDKRYSGNSRARLIPKERSCRTLWHTIVFQADGSVFPCCGAYRKKDSFGNAFKQTIREIWNNDNYIKMRRAFKNGQLPAGVPYPCADCHNFI